MCDLSSKIIDDFIGSYALENGKYRKGWKIIMLVFVLSHDQSLTEKGF